MNKLQRQWSKDYEFAKRSRACESKNCGGFTWLATRGALILRHMEQTDDF